MGKFLSVFQRAEPMIEHQDLTDQEVSQPDEVSQPNQASETLEVDPDSQNDLFEFIDHGIDEEGRPYFTVRGVTCYTPSKLKIELCKDDPKGVESVICVIDNEVSTEQPSAESVTLIQNKIEKCQSTCGRLRKFADKLEETKVDIMQLDRKQEHWQYLESIQSKRPIVLGNTQSGRYFQRAKTIRGQLLTEKIGDLLMKYQQAEGNRNKIDGSGNYMYLVTLHPTSGSTNCTIELVGSNDAPAGEPPNEEVPTRVSTQQTKKVPSSMQNRRPMARK